MRNPLAILGILLAQAIIGTLSYSNGSMLLVSSSNNNIRGGGRLDMYWNRKFYPFCASSFSIYAADIACRQFGYSYAFLFGTVSDLGYNAGDELVSIDLASDCSLLDLLSGRCKNGPTFNSYCAYSYVAIICTNAEGQLRLLSEDGQTNEGLSSGRLEILVNNKWSTVCDDYFGPTEATIACRQLGFNGYQKYGSAASQRYFEDLPNTPTWFSDFSCSSASLDLRACSGIHNLCVHTKDIILTCTTGRHSSAGIGIGIFLVLVAITVGIVVTIIILIKWKKIQLCHNNRHQLLHNQENENVVEDNERQVDNDENQEVGNNLKAQCLVHMADDADVTPTAPVIDPPKYEDVCVDQEDLK